ncbi:MAG TPA: LysR substrate-binding domain-containing protein [Acidimicrobiales bacterium]|nr:LysR substrate-binding domain-containing protein [Acidimicrobiales bacterium]
MTLNQLRTFLAVADTGSIRAAAERLFVTQPAVSSAVAALATEVGVPLVARDGRGLRLTPAGTVFARHVRQAMGMVDQAVNAAAGYDHPERGRVRLAAVTTAGERIVPRFLASFRRRYPESGVVLEVGNRRRVWDLLANREVDLAIGGRPPAGAPFVTLATRPNLLVVIAPPEPGSPQLRRVTLGELAGATWLLREPGSGTRGTTEELLHELELDPRVLTVGSNGAIVESVQAGLGITLLSRDAAGVELDSGAVQEWRHGRLPLRREWHLVGRADEELDATARLLLDHLDATPGRDRFTAVAAR